jgi:urea transporter
MSQVLVARLLGILINGVMAGVFAVIGRLLSGLAPSQSK